ncbi:hypothetical protein NDU88_006597 [Pleurodeles waltl]|uniref:Uncharacterized protein n=1 Tax=Pleurodeles waltl TaxID=8319 RepID=A0AAV7TX89_PLEWA|nr:hypothetical protein NDU88_006597 [Pleurodeles waltl]
MCRHEFQEVLRPRELQGGSNNGFCTPGALWWNRAALELRRYRRAVAQAPLCGEAGRGRASTSKGWFSPDLPKASARRCKTRPSVRVRGGAVTREWRGAGGAAAESPIVLLPGAAAPRFRACSWPGGLERRVPTADRTADPTGRPGRVKPT